MSVTDNGPRAFIQANLCCAEDVGTEFLKLLERIADANGLAKPEKVNKRWENVTDPLAIINKLCKKLSDDVWRGVHDANE